MKIFSWEYREVRIVSVHHGLPDGQPRHLLPRARAYLRVGWKAPGIQLPVIYSAGIFGARNTVNGAQFKIKANEKSPAVVLIFNLIWTDCRSIPCLTPTRFPSFLKAAHAVKQCFDDYTSKSIYIYSFNHSFSCNILMFRCRKQLLRVSTLEEQLQRDQFQLWISWTDGQSVRRGDQISKDPRVRIGHHRKKAKSNQSCPWRRWTEMRSDWHLGRPAEKYNIK